MLYERLQEVMFGVRVNVNPLFKILATLMNIGGGREDGYESYYSKKVHRVSS